MTSISVAISTYNRKEALLSCLQSCIVQSVPSLEIIVLDDGSTDGTAEAVAMRYPQVRLLTSSRRAGYIARRNEGIRDATGDIVFIIDDDAVYSDIATVMIGAVAMSARPDAGAIGLSYTEPCGSCLPSGQSLRDGDPIRAFRGCAHAVRKSAFLEVGGYREYFVHQGEERDLCIRLLDKGYSTVKVDTPPVHHNCSPVRDKSRMDYYGVRNTILFDFLNLPLGVVAGRLLLDSLSLLKHRLGFSNAHRRLFYLFSGYAACVAYRKERTPVSMKTYARYRALPLHTPARAGDGATLSHQAGTNRQ